MEKGMDVIRDEKTSLSINNSINYLRLICAYLVVVIHTQPFEKFSELLGFNLMNLIASLAVPFFFAISGYFYTNRLNSQLPFAHYMKRLLSSYCIWNGVYFVVNWFTIWRGSELTFKSFIADCFVRFFFLGGVISFMVFSGSYYMCLYYDVIFCH